jgi:transposase
MGNPAGVRRDFDALEKRRFEAIRLVQQGLNQLEVARRLKIARQTISRWMTQYRSEGKSALKKAGRAGRKPRMTITDLEKLKKLLIEGPEALGYETPLWTCPRVADLIQQKFDVSYHAGHVWKILVGLGWSPQRPVGKARERNEEEIRTWKRKRWPAIKKKPARKGARSSSSTRVE